MPVDYAVPTEVVTRSANRVRLTRVMLMLQHDNPEQDSARFHFTASKVEMIDDPRYVAPKIPQVDDPDFVQPDPTQPIRVPQVDDPDYVAPDVPQIEKLTTMESKTLTKKISEVAADHAADFVAVHAGIKSTAYKYMVSEGLFPAGDIT